MSLTNKGSGVWSSDEYGFEVDFRTEPCGKSLYENGGYTENAWLSKSNDGITLAVAVIENLTSKNIELVLESSGAGISDNGGTIESSDDCLFMGLPARLVVGMAPHPKGGQVHALSISFIRNDKLYQLMIACAEHLDIDYVMFRFHEFFSSFKFADISRYN